MIDQRRLRDLAFILPWAGLILLTPPMLTVLNAPVFVFGVPLLLIYVFVCWLALIVAGWRLSGWLAQATHYLDDRPRGGSAPPGRGVS